MPVLKQNSKRLLNEVKSGLHKMSAIIFFFNTMNVYYEKKVNEILLSSFADHKLENGQKYQSVKEFLSDFRNVKKN